MFEVLFDSSMLAGLAYDGCLDFDTMCYKFDWKNSNCCVLNKTFSNIYLDKPLTIGWPYVEMFLLWKAVEISRLYSNILKVF